MDEKINQSENISKNIINSQLELTIEDIVRDRTILDKLDIIPNPFESQNNTRINYPPFDDMFCSNASLTPHSPFKNFNTNSFLNSGSELKNYSNLSSSFNKSNHNDSSNHFRWSIDQIARLLPADISYQLQDDTLTIFRPHDEDTQKKLDEYFNNVTLPSPYTPDSKKYSPTTLITKLDEFTAEPSPTDLYISHGTNDKFLNNKHLYQNSENSTINSKSNHKYIQVSCQTDISINPEIDISKFLGELATIKHEKCVIFNTHTNNIKNNSYYNYHDNSDELSNLSNNSKFKNKDEFNDIKFIQNSTTNDLDNAFNQLNLSNNNSTILSNDQNKRKKNLHVTFKDDLEDISTFSYYQDDFKSNNITKLPNPLKHINTQNNINDQYILKTPPTTHNNLDYSFHDTPYVYNKSSCTFKNIIDSSIHNIDNNQHYIKKKLNFDSNMSSPTWHHHSNLFSLSTDNDINTKTSSIDELERIEQCFGSLDTSPIKHLYIFNSTITGDIDENIKSNTLQNSTISKIKDDNTSSGYFSSHTTNNVPFNDKYLSCLFNSQFDKNLKNKDTAVIDTNDLHGNSLCEDR